MMRERRAQDKSLFCPDNRKRYQVTSPTETPVRQSICHRYEKNGRSGTGTGKGGRKNRRSTSTREKGTNGSLPEKGLGGRDLGQRKGFRHRNAGFSLKSPGPEQSDLYITSGLQTMAITRKRRNKRSTCQQPGKDSILLGLKRGLGRRSLQKTIRPEAKLSLRHPSNGIGHLSAQ